ncbi:MAG: YqcI/YcgG family protein [Bacteroidota bacterium]|nr:YqcI/YcgG family protein [Bacteroidota bacterium]
MVNCDLVIVKEFEDFILDKSFPCVAAKTALKRLQIKSLVVGNIACPKDDAAILSFLYDFVDTYRTSTSDFHSAVIIFKGTENLDENIFDNLLWRRLQSLSDLDAKNYSYDKRVDINPASSNFSFSLKQEAFFIIGMNPSSIRAARKFKYAALIFNPHAQFEKLRSTNGFEKMKNIVRKRELEYSGSVNPMLDDFGTSSEVYQYSGVKYKNNWQCPLKISHTR